MYRDISDLPSRLGLFPLRSLTLFPRFSATLQVYEPRYAELTQDVMRGHSRILGVVRPGEDAPSGESVSWGSPLYEVGCAGRLTGYQELGGGRLMIVLLGVCRFRLAGGEELEEGGYGTVRVDYERYRGDVMGGEESLGKERRGRLEAMMKKWLEVRGLRADWGSLSRASDGDYVHALSASEVFDSREKQALLEAGTLEERAEMMEVLARMGTANGGLSGRLG